MKKLLSAILALAMLLCMVSCTSPGVEQSTEPPCYKWQ